MVNPQDPDLVVAGWNDCCSDWMGLGFSTDGGGTCTNSLVPGIRPTRPRKVWHRPSTSARTTRVTRSAPSTRADVSIFGALSYTGSAGPGTNADIWVARYDVVDPAANGGYPLDHLGTTRVGQGTPSANFNGRFLDKPMLEVDRTGGRFDGNAFMCFTKFPAFGQSEIYFAASRDHGLTFSKRVRISGAPAGQGCERDCGDGADSCPSGFVFSRVPLEPRLTAGPTGELPGVYSVVQADVPSTIVASQSTYSSVGAPSASGLVGQRGVYIMRSTDI